VNPQTRKVTIGTWNVFARPEVVLGNTGTPLGAIAHAKDIKDVILFEQPDVLVLNELFDEGVRDALEAGLASVYPHRIIKVDPIVNSPRCGSFPCVVGEDSGLYLISKFPFLPLATDKVPMGGPLDRNRTTDPRKYIPPYPPFTGPQPVSAILDAVGFEDCDNADCLAAKGAAVVRIDVPGTGKLNVAFTHTQADEPGYTGGPNVRKKQLAVVSNLLNNRLTAAMKARPNNTVLLGDLNIEGKSKAGIEYVRNQTQPLGEVVGGDRYSDAWLTTSPFDLGVSHRGQFPERLDYALMRSQPLVYQGDTNTDPNIANCVQWVRNALDGPSDHLGVLMDLGPTSDACNPGRAINVSANTSSTFRGTLPAPGSVMWYRIPNPDTFSIGFESGSDAVASLRMDVFTEDDLSKPIRPVENSTQVINGSCTPGFYNPDSPPAGSCSFSVKAYFPPDKPVYVRVYDPQGLRSGAFGLVVRRHDCASQAFACGLRPGAAARSIVASTTTNLTGYFFFPTDAPRTPDPQAMTVRVGNPSSIPLQVTLLRDNVVVTSTYANQDFVINRSEAAAAKYSLRVQRGPGSAHFNAGWTTNLFYIVGPRNGPAAIICDKETSGIGDDEIRLRTNLPSQDFWPGFGETDMQPISFLGPLVKPLRVTIEELTSETPNGARDGTDMAEDFLQTLPANELERRGIEQHFCFAGNCAQGDYRIRYDLVHSLR
jgi:endonuclease/exonuclease/phosphatase family metal-dependent hydrolase